MKAINKKNWSKENPFWIPEDYFVKLPSQIMNRIDQKKRYSLWEELLNLLKPKQFAPLTAIILCVCMMWYSNQYNSISENELIEVLTYYDIEESMLYEYMNVETEIYEEEYLLYEFDYYELINEL